MTAYFNLQDQKHPLADIYSFLKVVNDAPIKFPSAPTSAKNTSSMPTIAEDGINSLEDFQASFTNFDVELDKKVLTAHQHYYEDYKYLVLYVSFFMTQDETLTPNKFGKIIDLPHSIEVERGKQSPNILNALKHWQKTLKETSSKSAEATNVNLINLIIACYLYHLSLERVYFKWLGSVHDATAEKLFSQGLALYGLMQLCAQEAPVDMQANILKILNANSPPLAIHNGFKLDYGKSVLRPIRVQTQNYNLTRLFLVRLRRLILSINALNLSLSLQGTAQAFDPFLQGFLGLVNLLYFIPRLLSFIGPFIKHLYEYLMASEEDKKIDFSTQFAGQLHRRWEVILRDLIWFSIGFMSFFVFTGTLGFGVLYFSAAMQFLEVCLNGYLLSDHKLHKENTMNFFDKQKEHMPEKPHQRFVAELRRRNWLETENLERRLFNSSIILLSNILILPCLMSISVYISLFGALLAIGMTIIQYYYTPSWTAKLEHPPAFPVAKPFENSSKERNIRWPIASSPNLQGMSA